MTAPDIVWGSLILVGIAYEAYTLTNRRQSDTLSETTRSIFRTRTSRAGRIIFGAAWIAFSTWFTGHVLDWWW